MRVLALDPGAKRLGWAIVTDTPTLIGYGIRSCERGDDETYQKYRLRAVKEAVDWVVPLLDRYQPHHLICETVPVRGFNDMGQAYLAMSVSTAVQAIAYEHKIPVTQVGATSVKAAIGGTGKASKVRVRNGVLDVMDDPQLRDYAKANWKTVFDEPDAIAIALTHLGFKRPS